MAGKINRNSNNARSRQNYLRYDDIFMTSSSKNNTNNRVNSSSKLNQMMMSNNYVDDDDDEIQQDDAIYREDEYFSDSNILDERMIRYKKRELPPLQRYNSSNNQRDMYNDGRYSDQQYMIAADDYRGKKDYYNQYRRKDGTTFKSVWNKFIVTFTSALSLVCLSWIAYNWSGGGGSKSSHNNRQQPVVIEPDSPSFKILPDNPGGIDIPYQDRAVYENMGRGSSDRSFDIDDNDDIAEESSVLPSPEEPVIKPRKDTSSLKEPVRTPNNPVNNEATNIDEFSIVDEKTYYIKMATGPNKQILLDEIKNIKSKHADKIAGLSCSVKSVKDKNGNKKHAILIGPFDSKDIAVSLAKKLNTDCSVVAVKE